MLLSSSLQGDATNDWYRQRTEEMKAEIEAWDALKDSARRETKDLKRQAPHVVMSSAVKLSADKLAFLAASPDLSQVKMKLDRMAVDINLAKRVIDERVQLNAKEECERKERQFYSEYLQV